jgi:hypothetical protein
MTFVSVKMNHPFLLEMRVYWHQMASLITFRFVMFFIVCVIFRLCVVCGTASREPIAYTFRVEGGGSSFPWKIGHQLQDYVLSQLRRLSCHSYENLFNISSFSMKVRTILSSALLWKIYHNAWQPYLSSQRAETTCEKVTELAQEVLWTFACPKVRTLYESSLIECLAIVAFWFRRTRRRLMLWLV